MIVTCFASSQPIELCFRRTIPERRHCIALYYSISVKVVVAIFRIDSLNTSFASFKVTVILLS